jgi:para-aminobenzoate synthetase component 1
MVIDLARNDLGRVCRAGSIETVQSYKTEAFGGMEHLVTRVRGEVISGIGWRAVLKSTFPAASITGAPKSASTQAIARLEKSPRGVYCGACGIIGLETMDLNVAIRTISCEPAGDEHYQYRFGAGGAIVADSNISDEYEEMLRKSLPLVRAVADSNG